MKNIQSILLLLSIGFFQFGFTQSILSSRYHTYEEIQERFTEWESEFGANTNPSPAYPGSGIIYHVEEIGHSTQDQVPFSAVRLSYNANVDQDKPKILFLGQCHAEEIFGVEITMELIRRFLYPTPQYPIQNMRAILQSCEIWVVPTYNPEGLQVVHGFESDTSFIQDVSFRKNKRDVNENNLFDFIVGVGNDSDGVDLNRNYDLHWFFGDGPYEEDHSGGDYQSHFDYYRGEYPFSESETQAIRDFALEKQFLLSIAYHSSRSGNVSEKVIYPWMWALGKTSPDYSVISNLGSDIAGLIPKEADVGYYTPIPSVSRRGNTHDWLYAETGCIQYLIEVGTENTQPADTTIIEDTINRNLRGAFHLMNRSIGYGQGDFGAESYQVTGIVTDLETGLPIPDAVVEISELTGAMIKPRLTDSFGRYRRLLSQGTFTLNISAKGYQPHTEIITPSSVVPLEFNCSLTPLPQHTIALSVSSSDILDNTFNLYIGDEYSIDTMEIGLGTTSIIYPEQLYKIHVQSESIFPQIFSLDLVSDTTVTFNLTPKDTVYHTPFDHIEDWTILSSEWTVENGVLLSQNYLLYTTLDSKISSDQIILNNETSFVLKLDWQYEVEWGYDTVMIDIVGNLDTTSYFFNNQWWERHEDLIPVESESDSIQIVICILPDNSLAYRGIKLHSATLLSGNSSINTIDPQDVHPSFFVYPSYPNPFNPITHIRYQLPNESNVDVSVYNLLGQHIKTLVSEQQIAGDKHLIWNADSQSSGIYFLKITTDQHTNTQKLILLK